MAAVVVTLPVPLRRFVDGSAEVPAAGDDVAGALTALCQTRPELARRLLDDDGQPRGFLRLYVNGTDVRRLGGLQTPLATGDRLALVLALAGG